MKPILKRNQIETLFRISPTKRIGVLGDFVLDGYWRADMTQSQLSREAPLYNRPIIDETYSPGGAANVAWNLSSLSIGEVKAFSVFGEDWRHSILRSILEDLGVVMDNVITHSNWHTPFFGKVFLSAYGNQQEDARLDFINQQSPTLEIQKQLMKKITEQIDGLSAMIIADYLPQGVIGKFIIHELNKLAKEHPEIQFIVDSRDRLDQYTSMTIKPNEIEARQLFFPETDMGTPDIETLSKGGMEWQRKSGKPIYITLGAKGCLLCQESGWLKIPSPPVSQPIDTVGAGDSFLAGLTTGLVSGLSPEESVFFANLVASVTIQKIGITGTANLQEILEAYDNFLVDKN